MGAGGAVRGLVLFTVFGLIAGQCDKTIECCRPGALQDGDPDDASKGSFCTHKPFEEQYTLKIGRKAPIQLNLVDYCSDQVVYTSYIAAEVDKFTLVNFPCTYQPASCLDVHPDQQEACEAGKQVWTDLGCKSGGFWDTFISKRICNEQNYPAGNDKGYVYYGEEEADPVTPARVGGCNCNFNQQQAAANFSGVYTGVPDNYIKEGMSTFYIQIVIGGRSSSARDDPSCQCTGDDPREDKSEACMCMLGKRKVPFVYNYGILPYLTTLISMKNGKLIFQNTYVKYDFEKNGIGCVGCNRDHCWGVPQVDLEGWINKENRDIDNKENLMCSIPLTPDYSTNNDPNQAYCGYPGSVTEIEVCTLKIYVAWVGTDGYNHPAQSSNEMFSRFTQMGVANFAVDMYNGFSNLATDVKRRVVGAEDEAR